MILALILRMAACCPRRWLVVHSHLHYQFSTANPLLVSLFSLDEIMLLVSGAVCCHACNSLLRAISNGMPWMSGALSSCEEIQQSNLAAKITFRSADCNSHVCNGSGFALVGRRPSATMSAPLAAARQEALSRQAARRSHPLSPDRLLGRLLALLPLLCPLTALLGANRVLRLALRATEGL